MGTKTRLWRLGTELTATVIDVSGSMVVLVDQYAEAHIIAGVKHEVTPRKGDSVTMRFCDGGPMGGYWKIVETESPLEAA